MNFLTMQTAKDDIRETLLRVAFEEFVLHGFKHASMRTISEKSGVSLSNIYTYFSSKDQIFCAILQPSLLLFKQSLKEYHSGEFLTIELFFSEDYQRKMIRAMVAFVEGHREMLRLLFFKAGGSSLENYREQLAEQNIRTGLHYMESMKERYPYVHTDVSSLFVRTSAQWWICVLELLARSDDRLPEAEIEHFISDYIRFGTAGWKALMKI